MTSPRSTQMAEALLTYIAAGGRVQASIDASTGRARYCVSDEGILLHITERGESGGK